MKKIIRLFINYLKETKKQKYVDQMDMGDLGNEIGVFLYDYIKAIPGYELDDFISGLHHGIDLAEHNKNDKIGG